MNGDLIPDESEDDDPVCITCLVRPARPGSAFCGRLCRVLGRLRGLGVLSTGRGQGAV